MKEKETADTKRRPRELTLITFLQSLYLSSVFFSSNDLIFYASSCAFGFLFSFIPVVMMILVILIRFLHANPQSVTALLNSSSNVMQLLNLDSLANVILKTKVVTNFEVVAAIAIIWMARRLFASIMGGMHRIFKKDVKRQVAIFQLFVFVGEALLTILISVFIFIIITFRTLVHLPVLDDFASRYPELSSSFTDLIVNTMPFIAVFIVVTLLYKFESRTRPSLFICMIASLGCTFCFWGLHKLMRLFINVNRYSLVYGVLSNAIVVLIEIYFFFLIFLFFAQYLFVIQYFDTLLLSELYLLPERNDTRIRSTIKRLLFIHPDSLLHDGTNVSRLQKGDFIYRQGDSTADAYYLVSGTVQIFRTNNLLFVNEGKFFGEEACLLQEIRNENAVAHTDVKIVKIPEAVFFTLLERNPQVSRKALAQISRYFSKFYGRNDEYVL